MSTQRRLGILGGTFDPIHNGHLRAAEAAQAALSLDVIRVIPAYDPPHRPLDPRASAFHRFALVALAIDGLPDWELSDAEVTRSGPSYTAETLKRLHAEGWRPSQIFFILGTDAFAEIATWYDFPAVLDAANFAIVARPGTTLAQAAERATGLSRRLRPIGESVATTSRDAVGTGIFLIEGSTPDVSSTDIRRQLAAGGSIDDLVPAAVARYIQSQHLYDPNGSNDFPVDDLHGKTQHK
jgi:nicotinate-nucleotide adenylyltransferase